MTRVSAPDPAHLDHRAPTWQTARRATNPKDRQLPREGWFRARYKATEGTEQRALHRAAAQQDRERGPGRHGAGHRERSARRCGAVVTADGRGSAGFRGAIRRAQHREPEHAGHLPGGGGYWLVGSDGGVFAFGGAQFYGSLPQIGVHVHNIVGIISTPTGQGYWLIGSDGGVFSFGDASFLGSEGGTTLNDPVVGAALSLPSGPLGAVGPQGASGAQGGTGVQGLTGSQGAQGFVGAQGGPERKVARGLRASLARRE